MTNRTNEGEGGVGTRYEALAMATVGDNQ